MKAGNLLLIIVSFLGCKKEPVMPTTPVITLVDVSVQQVTEFEDRVSIRIGYKDGDGDLGRPDADDYSIWVKDARLNAADGYHIPPLAPPGAEVPIQGELTVELRPFFLLGNSAQETTTCTIHIVDRAGNRSNTVVTAPLIINAQTP